MRKAVCKHLLAIIFSFVSVPYVFAAVHPGLRDAIDKGDYKTAQNLKQKMNVRGDYLPATLSIKDAEFIYGSLAGYKWLLGLDEQYNCDKDSSSECSPEFVDKFIEKVCLGTTDFDKKACTDWMKSASLSELKKYKDSFCKKDGNLKACSLYVSMLDTDNQWQYLKNLDKKGLVEFTTTLEIDTTVKEKIPKKECLAQWDDMYKVIKASIKNDARYRQSRGYFYEAIICSFDGSSAKEKKCLSHLDEFSKMVKKDCVLGKMERDAQKKMQVKRPYKPFENVLSNISYKLKTTPWFAMDSLWVDRVQFVQKYQKKDGEEISREIKDYYSKEGKLPISVVKRGCITHSGFDNYVQKQFGVELFSCAQILSEYPNYLNADCEVNDSSWIRHLPTLLYNDTDSISFVCDAKTKKYRYADKYESVAQQICDNSEYNWEKVYYTETESAYYGTKKDTIPVVCDKVLGAFRGPIFPEMMKKDCSSTNDRERFAGGTCIDGYWTRTKDFDTRNRLFEPNKFVQGEVNSDFLYFKDFRDDQIYRAVKIGNQIWMTENLNYVDGPQGYWDAKSSWCYKNKEENCLLLGRLYTWPSAMDSAGIFSISGKGCRYGKKCTPIYPVRGICPEGWHLPDTTEWLNLYKAMGGSANAMQIKGLWDNATDEFGFSAIPAGDYDKSYSRRYDFDNVFERAYFWSSNEATYEPAYYFGLGKDKALLHYDGRLNDSYKTHAYSVRCVKDSP